jgi:hypothetical protein
LKHINGSSCPRSTSANTTGVVSAPEGVTGSVTECCTSSRKAASATRDSWYPCSRHAASERHPENRRADEGHGEQAHEVGARPRSSMRLSRPAERRASRTGPKRTRTSSIACTRGSSRPNMPTREAAPFRHHPAHSAAMRRSAWQRPRFATEGSVRRTPVSRRRF